MFPIPPTIDCQSCHNAMCANERICSVCKKPNTSYFSPSVHDCKVEGDTRWLDYLLRSKADGVNIKWN